VGGGALSLSSGTGQVNEALREISIGAMHSNLVAISFIEMFGIEQNLVD